MPKSIKGWAMFALAVGLVVGVITRVPAAGDIVFNRKA